MFTLDVWTSYFYMTMLLVQRGICVELIKNYIKRVETSQNHSIRLTNQTLNNTSFNFSEPLYY